MIVILPRYKPNALLCFDILCGSMLSNFDMCDRMTYWAVRRTSTSPSLRSSPQCTSLQSKFSSTKSGIHQMQSTTLGMEVGKYTLSFISPLKKTVICHPSCHVVMYNFVHPSWNCVNVSDSSPVMEVCRVRLICHPSWKCFMCQTHLSPIIEVCHVSDSFVTRHRSVSCVKTVKQLYIYHQNVQQKKRLFLIIVCDNKLQFPILLLQFLQVTYT